MPRTKLRKHAPALAVSALVIVALTITLSHSRFFQTLESRTLDYRFRLLGKQENVSAEIVLAEIDDNSIKLLEPAFGRWPWSRDVHGYFLNFMRRARARVVAYDILFLERDLNKPQEDAFLVEQTSLSGNVVHAVFLGIQDNEQITGAVDPDLLAEHTLPKRGDFTDFIQVDFPIPELAIAAASLGHVANALDSDGPFRRYLLLASAKGRTFPSLALAAAMAATGQGLDDLKIEERQVTVGAARVPLDSDWRLPIWFNGGPGTYKSYSYGQIVYSEFQIQEGETPGIDPEIFRDKIVFVGLSATGLHDLFTTPFSGSAGEAAAGEAGVRLGKMAGVEVHANVVDDLLHNRYLLEVPSWVNWVIGSIVTFLVLSAILLARLSRAAVACGILLAGYLVMVQQVFGLWHYKLPVVASTLCWALAIALGLGYQYWVEGSEKRAVKAIFSRYVSRDVFQQLMDDPEAARLGGRRTLVTVLFSDLRGFTSMSENREPEDIVAQLNEYFTAMVEIVFENMGTVDKFVGDMIMALFSAPLPDPIHADHAVRCAVVMQEKLVDLNRKWEERGLPPLACGVGINSGEMIAGTVGSVSIRSYTVIGDNVNLGARLESLCKEYASNIIISEFTRSYLEGAYDLVELGDVLVKGKSKPVKIFGVRGLAS